MSELIGACLGDKEKAIRLLEYERKRNPQLKTLEAIESALDRLCYDRGRTKREVTYDPKVFRRPTPSAGQEASGQPKAEGPPDMNAGAVMLFVVVLLLAFGFFSSRSKKVAAEVAPTSHVQRPDTRLPAQRALKEMPPEAPAPIPAKDDSPLPAPKEIFKCRVNGSTLYSDRPCAPGTDHLVVNSARPDHTPPVEKLDEQISRKIAAELVHERSIQTQRVANAEQTRRMECEALGRHIDWLAGMRVRVELGELENRIKHEQVRAQSRALELRCT